jgi:transposase
MERRTFSREFKVEAVRLVRERGVSVAPASRDVDVHENLLRKWVKQLADDALEAFPGHGRMKTAEAEIAQLKREVQKLKAERTAGKVYRTRDQARADVFDYIERFYNPRRRHSKLSYISPIAFEAKMRLARVIVHGTGDSSLNVISLADELTFVFPPVCATRHYSDAPLAGLEGSGSIFVRNQSPPLPEQVGSRGKSVRRYQRKDACWAFG